MPTSSTASVNEKKKSARLLLGKSIEQSETNDVEQEKTKNFLTIEPALPINDRRTLYKRSHSTLNATSLIKPNDLLLSEPISLHTRPDGSIHISRTQKEKENFPDRISLDRRGLNTVPLIDGEPKLRLLSLQHNLINCLGGLKGQPFPFLVFLDIYDNQIEKISSLDTLENLRVLLMGKNRIKKIENLLGLKKLEVLDLHGNQITQISGLSPLTELKVLNLAGNQIRIVGVSDLKGLQSLQELNLRRNKLKKLHGFAETSTLSKLFLSNNDLHGIEDICNLAKSPNIKEITIDNNPVALLSDCVSFLVSYLQQLMKLNTLQITDQVKKTAMAWRRNKEATNTAFMDLTSDVCLNVKRDEVISNAKINWEFIRSQTKCIATKTTSTVGKSLNNLKPDTDFFLTSLSKGEPKPHRLPKSKTYTNGLVKVPVLPDKNRFSLARTSSQDTENSQNTSSSNNSSNEYFRLPPILVPIIHKMEHRNDSERDGSVKLSGSLSSIGPNVDSSVSSLGTGSNSDTSSSESDSESEKGEKTAVLSEPTTTTITTEQIMNEEKQVPGVISTKNTNTDSSSNISSNNSNMTAPSTSTNESSSSKFSNKSNRCIRSAAVHSKPIPSKINVRASTAKTKKQSPPPVVLGGKDREQGGDYLIEICGRHLNIYGQGALRFIDKSWSASKANDVNTVKFNYVNFNGITNTLHKIKHKFPNIDNFVFKETNIYCLGQLNALAEVQGFSSLCINPEGNPICEKNWKSYAIYRLSHWGLKTINDVEVVEEDIRKANEEYQSLSDLVLWSLPDVLLQPLLIRLRLDVNQGVTEQNAKKWLLSADPALKSVVSKEALQWKKTSVAQDDIIMRQKSKQYLMTLLDEMSNTIKKLRLLEEYWPSIFQEFVKNTLLDYKHLDMYMKKKMQELNKH